MPTYLIQLQGQIQVEDLNPASPHHMTLVQASPAATRFSICTDQSGLIGLLRQLHHFGFTLQSITCQPEPALVVPERKEK